ncbi:hypothetical protein [Streptomyces zaomyceticus]|uniref:hypothetical protein n=1 Tax=Streptomyces zaomyceticus TaxID=68286 RepID=UPI0036B1F877
MPRVKIEGKIRPMVRRRYVVPLHVMRVGVHFFCLDSQDLESIIVITTQRVKQCSCCDQSQVWVLIAACGSGYSYSMVHISRVETPEQLGS